MKAPILKFAALNAFGTALYIAGVSALMFNAERIFGGGPDETVLIPIAMLLLFVLSASITGSLVLGRPILWYLDGKKKEAVSLLMATLSFLAAITLIAFLGLVVIARA